MSSPGRGTAHLMVAQMVLLVSGFAVSVLLARGLGPVDFGVYGVVMSVLGWLERTLNAGVPGAAASLLSREGEGPSSTERSARAVLMSWALPLFVLFWLGAPWLATYFGVPQHSNAFRIAALNIPAMALFYTYEGILKGRRRFAALSGLQTLQSLAKLGGVLLLLFVGISIDSAFIAHVAATLVPVLLAAMLLPLRGTPASRGTAWQLLKAALPLTLYSVALVILMNLSLWQLQHSGGGANAATGHFVASMNLTKILMVIPATTSGVLFVSLGWALANDRADLVRKYIQEAGRFALITLVPLCVLLAFDAEPVMGLLYGVEYAGSGSILAVLAVAFAAVALLDIYFFVLLAHGHGIRAVWVALALMPMLWAANHLLIARDGATGAAWAAALVLGGGALVQAWLVWLEFRYLVAGRTVLKIALASAVVGGLAMLWRVEGWMLAPKFVALGAVYLAVLFATRELRPHDLRPFAFWMADKKPGT
jgi:O-antigen/teichoic acid export membrane protein